jgi:hypothetical protein
MHKKGLEDTGFLDVREEVYKVLEWLYGEISKCQWSPLIDSDRGLT